MSLVSGFISNISNVGLSGFQAIQNFDLSDTAFENILESQLKAGVTEQQPISGLGTPPGFEINPLDIQIEKSNDFESGIFDFAKKQAASFYNQQAKNLVMDLNEFVVDVLKN